MAVSLLAAVLVGATTTAAPVRADDIGDATALFNAARARYGAGPLAWNADLVDSMNAQAATCRFQHSPGALGGRYGENLYAATMPTTIRDAVNAWMAEAGDYDYDDPVFAENTGHFTAMVWKGSTGFAVVSKTDCPAGSLLAGVGPQTLVIARFTPAGNVPGRFRANVGRPR